MNYSKYLSLSLIISLLVSIEITGQALRIPSNANIPSKAGRNIGLTEISIHWNAPGVKGREGEIWGTDIAYFGTQVLGFGSDVESPWRAGADECTQFVVSEDVTINGKMLSAGQYALFMELQSDSTTLIFNENIKGWGSYFYDSSMDVLRVKAANQKNVSQSKERLEFTFSNQTPTTVEVALEWEKWRIPFLVESDVDGVTLRHIKGEMSGALGFDPPSLLAAATWCMQRKINLTQALTWVNSATNPNLGGLKSFNALSIKAGILDVLGKQDDAKLAMKEAMDNGSAIEIHQYGRQLLSKKMYHEGLEVFQKNYDKFKGVWPTTVGLMRGYSATGELKKALQYGKLALAQAPDDLNRKSIETALKTLESGKALQ